METHIYRHSFFFVTTNTKLFSCLICANIRHGEVGRLKPRRIQGRRYTNLFLISVNQVISLFTSSILQNLWLYEENQVSIDNAHTFLKRYMGELSVILFLVVLHELLFSRNPSHSFINT